MKDEGYELIPSSSRPTTQTGEGSTSTQRKTQETWSDGQQLRRHQDPNGVADSTRLNRQYKELLVNLEVDKMDNRSISNECHQRYLNHSDDDDVHVHDSSHSRDTMNRNTGEILTIPTATQDIIVYLRIVTCWSILSLCSKFWVTEQETSHIFNKFK